MPSRDRILPWLLIPLVALFAILPLLRHGCSCGHDLDFHLLSWQEAAVQFAHGTLHPRWAFTPAYGAGEPRFVFYPPLSWTLGGLLTLLAEHLQPLISLLPWRHHHANDAVFAVIPVIFTWIALAAAGFAMLHLARRFLPPAAALFVATLYLTNPYTLFTAYERTAFAELLAAAWLPLLLAALLPSPSSNRPQSQNETQPLSILATAVPLALLWLTNAPAAVIGSYALAVIVFVRITLLALSPATRPHLLPLALRAVAATTVALALAAFYILPAVLERPWVQIVLATVPGMRPDDNTLFHGTADPFHDTVLRSASRLALVLLTITLGSIVIARTRHPRSSLLPLLASLTLLIGILLTSLSLPLWHHLPELAFLQFPWRLLALLAPIAALALGLALPHLPRPALLALALFLPLLLIGPAYTAFHQECDPDDTPHPRFALFHSPDGDDPTDEYTPTPADNDSLQHNNPPFRLLSLTTSDDAPPPADAQPGPAPLTLDLHLTTPQVLVLNLRDYPTWHVLLNRQPDPERAHRADGLLAIPLPAGDDHLEIVQRPPPLELAANTLSAFTLLGTLAATARRRKL